MKPIYEAKKISAEAGENFEKELTKHLIYGVVVSLPDRFIMGRAMQIELGPDIIDPVKPDCWFVHCAVGQNCLRWFVDQAPFKLPYIAWRRNNDQSGKLRVYNIDVFKRLSYLVQ